MSGADEKKKNVNIAKGVDVEEIKRNAIADGIDLQSITLIYSALDEYEKTKLADLGLLQHQNGNIVLATFTASGEALFPEKITGAHKLSAD